MPIDIWATRCPIRAITEPVTRSAKYQERDPIVLFKDSLKEAKVFGDKDFEKIEQEAVEAVERAVKFADESPFPDESRAC